MTDGFWTQSKKAPRASGPILTFMDAVSETWCLGGEVGVVIQGGGKSEGSEGGRHEFEPCLMAPGA